MPFALKDQIARDFDWSVYGCDIVASKKIANAFILNFEQFTDRGKGLYIYSKTKGAGKTMLACCLANELLSVSMSVKFITVLDLMELKKSSYEKGVEHVQILDELKSLYDAGLLILDDMGVELRSQKNEHTDQVLYQIINSRMNSKRVTIFTSNLKIEELKTDDRTKDRISKMSIMVNLPEIPVRKIMTETENEEFIKTLLA